MQKKIEISKEIPNISREAGFLLKNLSTLSSPSANRIGVLVDSKNKEINGVNEEC